jgi:putative PIN family toxin of toxin-antitoxin system
VRVLFDTNVLVSAVLFGGLPGELLNRALRGELEMVTSAALMDELEGVLIDTFSLDRSYVRSVRSELELLAVVVSVPDVPRVVRDPDDDAVLAAAIAGGALLIVTGDRDLLVLGEHHGIRIVTPRDFASSS